MVFASWLFDYEKIKKAIIDSFNDFIDWLINLFAGLVEFILETIYSLMGYDFSSFKIPQVVDDVLNFVNFFIPLREAIAFLFIYLSTRFLIFVVKIIWRLIINIIP